MSNSTYIRDLELVKFLHMLSKYLDKLGRWDERLFLALGSAGVPVQKRYPMGVADLLAAAGLKTILTTDHGILTNTIVGNREEQGQWWLECLLLAQR